MDLQLRMHLLNFSSRDLPIMGALLSGKVEAKAHVISKTCPSNGKNQFTLLFSSHFRLDFHICDTFRLPSHSQAPWPCEGSGPRRSNAGVISCRVSTFMTEVTYCSFVLPQRQTVVTPTFSFYIIRETHNLVSYMKYFQKGHELLSVLSLNLHRVMVPNIQ